MLALTIVALSLHPPRFDGVFVSLNEQTALWNETVWRADLEAMAAVSMTFLILPHTLRQSGPPTSACPSGTFEAHYELRNASACFKQVGVDSAGGTVIAVLAAANATGLKVHLGLAMKPHMDDPTNTTAVRTFAWLQWEVAQQLWQLASTAGLLHTIEGFYTEVEESNSHSWVAGMELFAGHYLQSLAQDIKTQLRADLKVWSSPYAVANRSRYPASLYVLPSLYGALWEETFAAWAPALDHVALQDSTGALGNSFGDVRQLLGNVSAASARQGRSAWTNIELFEVWPSSCEWPAVCHGRHPAPFERIRQQLENEAPLLRGPEPKIIAWEWTSCLSPTEGNGAAFPDANRANYAAYRSYLRPAHASHTAAASALRALPAPRALLARIAAWIMTLGVGSNNVSTSVSPYHSSIFINSNMARVLLASFKLTGDASHLAEGLRWCDAFVADQVPAYTHDGKRVGGWWNTGYDTLYIADTGTAVTALALCQDLRPKPAYLEALLRFATFVQLGTNSTPRCVPKLSTHAACEFDSGLGERASGWVHGAGTPDAGALGDGYYQGRLNLEPYTISTATTGGAFYAELSVVGARAGLPSQALASHRTIATNAAKWLVSIVAPNGSIPYIITPATSLPHTYQCISYTAEAFIDVSLRFGSAAVPGMLEKLNKTVEYVLAQQAPSGALLPNGTSGEVQRSPRAASLLQWWLLNGSPDARVADALERYVGWLSTDEGAKASGLNALALSTGFIGLALADLIEPWVTFAHA